MTMDNQVGGFSTVLVVTPTVSVAPAYTAQDQVGGIQTLAVLDTLSKVRDAACQDENSISYLASIVVHDKNSQNADLVIFFFNALPTVASVDNGAITISDAEMATKCIGAVSVPASSYHTVASSSIATVLAPSCLLAVKSTVDDGPIYAVVKTLSTPTYTSTSDLTFKYSFSQDLGNGRSQL